MKREVMQDLIDRRQEQRADIYAIERQDEINFTINGHKYELLTEYRDGFQTTKLEERFSSILSKYDYIVGDWGFEQLRLKGFFAPENPLAQKTTSVDTIQDYLYEYCNFGCAYFVIKNLEVKLPRPERQTRKSTRSKTTTKPANPLNKNSGSKKASTPRSKQGSTKSTNATTKSSVKSTSHKQATKQNNKNNETRNQNNRKQTRNNKVVKPQIKEREIELKQKPLNQRANQTAERVNGNSKSKQKFVIRHK